MSSNQAGTTTAASQQKQIKIITTIVLQGLRALGFEAQTIEKSEKQLVFNSSMFIKPNSKAFEHIVHFLLTQLDPERASRLFAQCWPPLCKETIKDFKDAIFSWLVELAPPTAAAATSAASAAAKAPQQQQQQQTTMANSRLLQLIRFPAVSKSLLAVPSGIKACELLLALTIYVILAKLARLINANKSTVRIYPKVSPLYQSIGESSGGKQPFATTTSTNSLNWAAHSTRFASQKQANHFTIQSSCLKQTIDRNNEIFNKILQRQLDVKLKFQYNMRNLLEDISNLIELKSKQTESNAKKMAFLAELGFGKGENGYQSMYAKFKETKEVEFEADLAQLLRTRDRTVANETQMRRIEELIKGFENGELNGAELVDFFTSLDANSSNLFDLDIDEILKENRTKLDLTNLVKLKKFLMSEKIDSMNKINTDQFVNTLNYIFNGSCGETVTATLIGDVVSSSSGCDQTFDYSSLAKNKSINEETIKLKKKLDTIGPKMEEQLDETLKTMMSSLETNRVAEEDHDQRFIDMQLINELDRLDERFYALVDRKNAPLDLKLLEELKQKETPMDINIKSDETGDKLNLFDMVSAAAQNNSEQINWLDDLSTHNENVEPGNETIENEMENNEECSLGIIDLEGIIVSKNLAAKL